MRTRAAAAALGALFALLALGIGTAVAITDTDGRTRVTDAAALRTLFAEHTFYGHYADDSRFVEYYAPDGRLGYWDGCPHAGNWWVKDADDAAVVCFVYPTMAPPGPHCFDVFRAPASRGGRLEFLADGTPPTWPTQAYTTAIRPGNPEWMSLTESGCRMSRLPDHGRNG